MYSRKYRHRVLFGTDLVDLEAGPQRTGNKENEQILFFPPQAENLMCFFMTEKRFGI